MASVCGIVYMNYWVNTSNPLSHMKLIRLLVTDFDGTVFRYGNEKPFYPPFLLRLDQLRQSGGAWVVCSGRSLGSLRKVTRTMVSMGVSPDIIITRHSHVYANWTGIWHPKLLLSIRTMIQQHRRGTQIAKDVEKLISKIRGIASNTRTVHISKSQVRVLFSAQEDVAPVKQLVSQVIADSSDLRVFWRSSELEIRTISHSKAVVIRSIAENLGIQPHEILTIGDGRTDIGMMSHDTALMTGCPANARREVIQHILAQKGHVASKDSLAGVIEIIDAYVSGNVKSEPPPGWEVAEQGLMENGHAQAARPGASSMRVVEISIVVAAVIVGILTLANFGIIPFGHYLLKPYQFFMSKLMGLFI
ncbi:MAG: HAD hydrolase family protein [Kiritimatiellia bacterium]|nr:HAD hydrolase family protein [Kiritimatiellia bacterium]MDP6847543.1 HAD hydrolase family protein [Kiritimatiellia bacterium]